MDRYANTVEDVNGVAIQGASVLVKDINGTTATIYSDNGVTEARDMYEKGVALDPTYAPAWARLGRARRVLAKYGGPQSAGLLAEAEAAFRRALEIDPHLSIAHDLATYVDAELGRAPEAMRRLLERATTRPADARLLAGLVIACRYAGLLDESLDAHRRASACDPSVRTSVAWTHFLLGELASAIEADRGSPAYAAIVARALNGDASAIHSFHSIEASTPSPGTRLVCAGHRLALERRVDEALAVLNQLHAWGFADPEGWYVSAFLLARAGATDGAIETLSRVVDAGYAGCLVALDREPAWTALLGTPAFDTLVARVRSAAADAQRIFDAAGGDAVLAASRR